MINKDQFNYIASKYDIDTYYEDFIQNWIDTHISEDVMKETEDDYNNYETLAADNFKEYAHLTFEEYIETYGFSDGSIYPSKEEFADNDFWLYVLASEIENFMYERGEYEYSDKIRWLDEGRINTENNIRKDLENNPSGLINYLNDEIYTMDEEDELISVAKSLIKMIFAI